MMATLRTLLLTGMVVGPVIETNASIWVDGNSAWLGTPVADAFARMLVILMVLVNGKQRFSSRLARRPLKLRGEPSDEQRR